MPPHKDQNACKAVARGKRLTKQRGQSLGDYRLSTFLPENLIQKKLLLPPRSPIRTGGCAGIAQIIRTRLHLGKEKMPLAHGLCPPRRSHEPTPRTAYSQNSAKVYHTLSSLPVHSCPGSGSAGSPRRASDDGKLGATGYIDINPKTSAIYFLSWDLDLLADPDD